jgi:hypothetical protein
MASSNCCACKAFVTSGFIFWPTYSDTYHFPTFVSHILSFVCRRTCVRNWYVCAYTRAQMHRLEQWTPMLEAVRSYSQCFLFHFQYLYFSFQSLFPVLFGTPAQYLFISVDRHIYIYIYIYIHTHTHTHMHIECSERLLIGWSYARQFPKKALSHLRRKVLPRARNR